MDLDGELVWHCAGQVEARVSPSAASAVLTLLDHQSCVVREDRLQRVAQQIRRAHQAPVRVAILGVLRWPVGTGPILMGSLLSFTVSRRSWVWQSTS